MVNDSKSDWKRQFDTLMEQMNRLISNKSKEELEKEQISLVLQRENVKSEPDKTIICKTQQEFTDRMLVRICGTERLYIPTEPHNMPEEEIHEMQEAAKENNIKFMIPSVIEPHGLVPSKVYDHKPYISLFTHDKKIFIHPIDGSDAFSDLDGVERFAPDAGGGTSDEWE